MIKLTYNKETDILDIKFSDNKVKDSEYIKDSGIVVDYDDKNKMVGIEILSFSKKASYEADLKVLEG